MAVADSEFLFYWPNNPHSATGQPMADVGALGGLDAPVTNFQEASELARKFEESGDPICRSEFIERI